LGIGGQAACRQASAVVPVATYLSSRTTRICSGMIRKAFSCYRGCFRSLLTAEVTLPVLAAKNSYRLFIWLRGVSS
jgi:hypothetical protein